MEIASSQSESVTKNKTRIAPELNSKMVIDDDEEGKSNPQGGGQTGLLQKVPDSKTIEKPEENEDELSWGHKYFKMKEDDTIYEMGYKDGNKTNSVKILISDFNRLEPSVYLNDTLILFFLKFLQNYVLTGEQVEKIHIFNSFFMQMIT